MRILIITVLALLFYQNLLSQVIISGQIKNSKSEALSRINILVHIPGTELLVAFSVSDEEGVFQTEVNSTSDSLHIEVSSVHYRNKSLTIANSSQYLQLQLEKEQMQLESFTVNAPAIRQYGDTISYLVSSFAGKDDRSIEDVLRNMPGIEVEPNGRILYEGMPLKKFYVEGLDLMKGRYGIISKNLPHGSVGTVEILENHQPVRIYEDKISEYRASMNLKLKSGITTTGTARIGGGYKPFLWDINLTPLTFTKKFQMVSSYQSNNIGNDVAQQLRVFTFKDLINIADRPPENPKMLSIHTVSPPDINEDRYLDNSIHLLNFNILHHLGNELQLRSNIFYINDFQKQEASRHSTLLSPSDTISFNESFDNCLNYDYLHGEFSLSRNTKNNYLTNDLKIQSKWEKQTGNVLTDDKYTNQALDKPFMAISNELVSINPIGKLLVEFRSCISYDDNQYNLNVLPGPYENVLNRSDQYDQAKQFLVLKRFYTDNSAGSTFTLKRLTISPQFGFSYRQQLLESNIIIEQQNVDTDAGPDFVNNLKGRQTHAYFKTVVEYRKTKFSVKAALPLGYRNVYLYDSEFHEEQHINRFLFEPVVSLNYKINGFWKVRGAFSHSIKSGSIDRVHYGFILRNYRNLNQNAAPLSETLSQNISLHLSYRNLITSFFNTINYAYARNITNLMYANFVQSDGTSITMAFNQSNWIYSHSLMYSVGKYISAAKTTIRLKANFNHYQGKSMLNDALFNTTNIYYRLAPEITLRITRWLNSEYGLNATLIDTYIEDEHTSSVELIKHHLHFFLFPAKNQDISLRGEYYSLYGNNNLFIDLQYRYSFLKRKIDLELRWNNVFNARTHTTYEAINFGIWESIYTLRPSQVFLSVKFSF
jgi:hypothetical protein